MKLVDVIFCDDIRKELNNKLSLMGIYTDKIVIFIEESIDAPIHIKLSTFLRFELEVLNQYPNRFEFEYILNKKVITKFEGNFATDKTHNYANLVVMPPLIPLDSGSLGFSVKLLNNNNILFTETREKTLEIEITK